MRVATLMGLILGVCLLALMNGSPEVKFVTVNGDINQQQRNEVLEKLTSMLPSGPSIDELKMQLEEISWISTVTVKRQWPDSLIFSVIAQTAIALWNDDAFINQHGEVFSSEYQLVKTNRNHELAQLYGPVGSEKEVMQQFQQLNNVLFKVGQSIDVIQLDERGAWVFKSNAGIEVLLGKDELMERIHRLLLVSEYVEKQQKLGHVQTIDTRYSNGVAIRWKAVTDAIGMPRDGMEIANTFNSSGEHKL